jgi:GntR family transcriptional regulator of abcA and norABC
VLHSSFGFFPVFAEAVRSVLSKADPETMDRFSHSERASLCDVIASHMRSYGLELSAENVLLSKGVNHSLLYVAQTFFAPSAVCYYVAPSVLDSFSFIDLAGLTRAPVPSDREGIDLDYFSGRINKRENAFIVVEPEIHAFSGLTMSMKRRVQLYNICYANRIPIIELDEFRGYHDTTLPPIKAMDKHGIVFYLSGVSKTFTQSLDAGWIAADANLIERLYYYGYSMWYYCEKFDHLVLSELLKSGAYGAFMAHVREDLSKRGELLNSLLEEYLSDIAVWDRNSELFFRIIFHDYIDVENIVLNEENLLFSSFSSGGLVPRNSILVSLTWTDRDTLNKGIKQLSRLARKSIKVK